MAQSVAWLQSNGIGAKVVLVVLASAISTAYAAEQQLPDLLGPAVPGISVVATLQGLQTFLRHAFWQKELDSSGWGWDRDGVGGVGRDGTRSFIECKCPIKRFLGFG